MHNNGSVGGTDFMISLACNDVMPTVADRSVAGNATIGEAIG
jgi:hypothetical protein